MEISYVGHSCFRMRGRDATIVTDPFSPAYGLSPGRLTADIVMLSHEQDPDHSYVQGISGEPKIVRGPGEYEIAGVMINGVRTYTGTGNGSVDPTRLRLNTVFVIDLDEFRICHLGDLGDRLSHDQVESIGSINVLMVPVGGAETIGPNLAAEVVSQLEPSIVVPMHYRIPGTRSERLESVDRFMREMGAKSADPVPKIVLNGKSSLPADIQVSVMDHRKD